MKIASLARKLAGALGGAGERELDLLMSTLASRAPELAAPLTHVLEAANRLLEQYVSERSAHSALSGDAFSDWHLQDGRIVAGRRWKTLLGYAKDELPDSIVAWRAQAHPGDLKAFDTALAAHALGRCGFFRTTCRLRTRTGGWQWLLLKGRIVARNERGEPLRMLLLQRDISDFKQAEEAAVVAKEAAEAANRARGTFLANMSHEIRTPMNGIIGMTDLALDTRLDAEQRHYLKTVKSSAESLLAIVNDILDFSKIEAGKLRFEEVPFSLSNLVYDVARAQALMAHAKGLELIVAVADAVPGRLIGDPARLRQVLANLIGNAIKFTERGEIAVAVEVEESAGGSVILRFSVRDTGIGIPLDRQAAIFEAFSQGDDSTTRRFGGTGLGLTICRHLVQMMGGRLGVESVEGQSSCFHFTGRFAAEPTAVAAPTSRSFAGQRALLLEQHPIVAAQLAATLQKYGIEPSVVEDPAQAVKIIDHSRASGAAFDFVLIDALVPPPGGLALATSWQGGGCPEKLIVLLTTEQQRQDLGRLRALGVGTHLVKPIAADDLLEALRLVSGTADDATPFLASFDFPADPVDSRARAIEVLLVEDNPVNQELARRLLEKRAYRVTLANNGAEAIEQFEQKRFDVILMDMQMPVMGGIEATESIRAREMRRSWVMADEIRPVRIIAMTANAMEGDRDRCLQAGMNDYLAKPIRPQDLYGAMDRCLAPADSADLGALPPTGITLTATSLDLAAAARDLGDRDLLLTMARMLLDEWNQHLTEIRSSLDSRQGAQLSLAAHTLKSLLAIFHAEKARSMALELESAARESAQALDWTHCARIVDSLTSEMDRLKPEIERFARRQPGV